MISIADFLSELNEMLPSRQFRHSLQTELSLTSQGSAVMKTLVVVVLLAIVEYGSAIVCYECNSAINSMCAAAILPDSLKRNCSDHDRGVKHTLCRKIIQHVDHEINGHQIVSRVIRSCGWDETKYKGSCYHRSGYGGRQEVCSCSKDLCNDSVQIAPSYLFLGFVLVFLHQATDQLKYNIH